jgi:hypothetical protein
MSNSNEGKQTMPILLYIAMWACALGTATEMAASFGPPRGPAAKEARKREH